MGRILPGTLREERGPVRVGGAGQEAQVKESGGVLENPLWGERSSQESSGRAAGRKARAGLCVGDRRFGSFNECVLPRLPRTLDAPSD